MSNSPTQKPEPLRVQPFGGAMKGEISFGGDKSISHRAVIFASLATGQSRIEGLSAGADVAATINIMRSCGVAIEQTPALCIIKGVGLSGLSDPENVLDCGNSGTTARLLLGLLAASKISCVLTGDSSLRARPMSHVMEPLKKMGANFVGAPSNTLPLVLEGSPVQGLTPIEFASTQPSAQLKSALILAALLAPGTSTISETTPTRDHTERMLDGFGAAIEKRDGKIIITGQRELQARNFLVPGDVSSAAFFAALAVMNDKADVLIKNISANPHRINFFEVLKKMGADIDIIPKTEPSVINEPLADIRVKGGRQLLGIDVAGSQAVGLIDEYPILSVVAAYASGTTNMRALSQLRVKESNRLEAIAENLNANGVEAQIRGDDLTIIGTGGQVAGGALVKTHHDHRIAMAFLVLGAAALAPITIDDSTMISTSFPAFSEKMKSFGVVLEQP